jgi:hypothetical protein
MEYGRVRVRGSSIALLGRRDWIYILSLLVPLVVYELALKVDALVSEYPDSGVGGRCTCCVPTCCSA